MAGEIAIAKQVLSESGVLHTFTNADTVNDNKFQNPNGNDIFLVVKNPGASVATATITAQKTSFSKVGEGVLTKADSVISLNAGEEKMVGPFPKGAWNDANGDIILTAGGAGAADIDYAVIQLPKY